MEMGDIHYMYIWKWKWHDV